MGSGETPKATAEGGCVTGILKGYVAQLWAQNSRDVVAQPPSAVFPVCRQRLSSSGNQSNAAHIGRMGGVYRLGDILKVDIKITLDEQHSVCSRFVDFNQATAQVSP